MSHTREKRSRWQRGRAGLINPFLCFTVHPRPGQDGAQAGETPSPHSTGLLGKGPLKTFDLQLLSLPSVSESQKPVHEGLGSLCDPGMRPHERPLPFPRTLPSSPSKSLPLLSPSALILLQEALFILFFFSSIFHVLMIFFSKCC